MMSLKSEGRRAESSKHHSPSPSITTAAPKEQGRSMVVDSLKAIIGWEPTSSLGSPNIGIAYLTLLGTHLFIGLCGVDELTKQANNEVLSGMVTIQCGGGAWMDSLHLPPDVIVHNLSQYSTFSGSYGGCCLGSTSPTTQPLTA